MESEVNEEKAQRSTSSEEKKSSPPNKNSRLRGQESSEDSSKRRCVSTACVACRRRKSKCDGNKPCAACSQVYGTQCVYSPNSDHRRKGVYRKDFDNLKTKNATLQTIVQAILDFPEDDVWSLVRRIRETESLDKVAEYILSRDKGLEEEKESDDEPVSPDLINEQGGKSKFEAQLSSKMGQVQLNGSTRYVGGTSNLIYFNKEPQDKISESNAHRQHDNPITSWTNVTSDPDLITHLLNHYFTWHHSFFTTLSKSAFYRQFRMGHVPSGGRPTPEYCSPLLVNAMCALGCHFTSKPAARDNPEDSATAGDHFFREARNLIVSDDEFGSPRVTTVQALALMSVREAGCGREAIGWQYSGMAFRMACDLGLNYRATDSAGTTEGKGDEEREDVNKITFWGCYLFDKCWSNYLGRLPMFTLSSNVTLERPDVWPNEEAETWCPYTDAGFVQTNAQPCRTRAVALQILTLCDISGDLMNYFYHPSLMEKPVGKQTELKRLSDIHSRLEEWRKGLPKELEPKEGTLSSVIVMHMFFQLLSIHLFRPFLKYTPTTSPLPAHVSPRKICTQAATMISRLMRLYKRSHGLRQICNIVVYIVHSACSIHLLNLPDKNAKRDITHGVRQLEEIAESWLCARRTLVALIIQTQNWNVELPQEAANVLSRNDKKYGPTTEVSSWSEPPPQLSSVATTPRSQNMPPPLRNYREDGMSYQKFMQHPMSTMAPSTTSDQMMQFPSDILPMQHSYGDSSTMESNEPMSTTFLSPLSDDGVTSAWNIPQETKPTPGTSSDMFGGVEALLRNQQDWLIKDQSQVAKGFDNWAAVYGPPNGQEPPNTHLNRMPNTAQPALPPVQHPQSLAENYQIHQADANITNSAHRRISVTADQVMTQGPPEFNGLPAYGAVAEQYNEAEWYR